MPMQIDVARRDGCFAVCREGVTAALEERERGREHNCLLRTLTNTRPTPATVVVRLQERQVVRLALLPFQKLAVYPPLVVAGGAQTVFGTFAVE
jgi:hypothetical protein